MMKVIVWGVLAVVFWLLTMAIPFGAGMLYTNAEAQHACTALNLLTLKPVPRPSDPGANPSREISYEFYVALLSWDRADHCE
jgi:hypothetical protein